MECSKTYLRYDIKAIAYLIQCLPKPSPVVRSVELDEAKQCMLLSPPPGGTLLNPVPGDRKVSIGVGSLPCITCQAYLASHSRALISCG